MYQGQLILVEGDPAEEEEGGGGKEKELTATSEQQLRQIFH